jgi:hypothetical protein
MSRSASPPRIDRRFAARRLAAAEVALNEALARLSTTEHSSAQNARATDEIERAAARVRYWRELQRQDATHPRIRACRLLGHTWATSGDDPTGIEMCPRCGTVRETTFSQQQHATG